MNPTICSTIKSYILNDLKSSIQMVLQLKRWKNMWCIRTYCTAMNDLSLNRISKDNEKFDRWVKWVGNEIRVKFCLSENEMCVWNFGRAHGLKNRKSNASFLTNTFICLYLQCHMCKGVQRYDTYMYMKEISEFTCTGRVEHYKFVKWYSNLSLY